MPQGRDKQLHFWPIKCVIPTLMVAAQHRGSEEDVGARGCATDGVPAFLYPCISWDTARLRSPVAIKCTAVSRGKALHKSQVLWLIIIYGDTPLRDSPSVKMVSG